VKKLFALLAVCSLAVFVGCDDKKSTGKPSNATTGGTYDKKDTVRHDVNATVTNTVVQHTAVETNTKTVAVTKTVDATKTPDKGPGLPDSKDKKPGDGR
jgi:hypothetical protein